QQLGPGGMLQIDTQLVRTGAANSGGAPTDAGKPPAGSDETIVEMYVGTKGGEAEKRGQQVVAAASDGPSPGELSLGGLDLGTHQGFLRVAGTDPLPCDDIRYFTVEVRPPSQVLLLGQSATDTVFLREALAPSAAGGTVPTKFVCEEKRFEQLSDVD